jgi:hypothetical protein
MIRASKIGIWSRRRSGFSLPNLQWVSGLTEWTSNIGSLERIFRLRINASTQDTEIDEDENSEGGSEG